MDFRLDFKTRGPDPAIEGCTLVEASGNVMNGILYKMPVDERRILDEASGIDKGLWAELESTSLDKDGNTSQYVCYPRPGQPLCPTCIIYTSASWGGKSNSIAERLHRTAGGKDQKGCVNL